MADACRRLTSSGNANRWRATLRWTRHATAAFLALMQIGAFAGVAPAAKFDEKIKAPPAPTNAELKAVIRDYFDTYARVNAESSAGIVRDRAAYQQWFETQWRLQRAIDQKRPLGNLSEFGLSRNADGSYSVDLTEYPQWEPLPVRLDRFREAQLLDIHVDELRVRGFRDADIEALRAFIAKSPPRDQSSTTELDITEGYFARVKAQLAAKQKASASQLLSYMYQSRRIGIENERMWALGFLDSFDQQRQRILESYLQEQGGGLTIVPDDIDGLVKFVVDGITSGDLEQQINVERKESRP